MWLHSTCLWFKCRSHSWQQGFIAPPKDQGKLFSCRGGSVRARWVLASAFLCWRRAAQGFAPRSLQTGWTNFSCLFILFCLFCCDNVGLITLTLLKKHREEMCSSVSSAGQTARKTCSTLQCPKQQDKTEALNLASPPLLCRFRQRKHKRQLRSTYTFHDKSPLCARRLAFKPLLVVLSPRHELTSFSEVDSWHVRQHVRNEDKGEPMLLLYGTTI